MADPSTYRPEAGSIPDSPGVYRFRDAHDRVIYVGKAKNLRSRLASYFQDIASLHPRTATMVTTAAAVDWVVVNTEVDALQLEYSWIKEYDPRFNVRYRDDKSYPYLAVTLAEQFPRITVMRGAKRPGVRYFGPYSHAWAIRESVDLLLRVFPVRTCSKGVFRRAGQVGRPCLLGYIGKCSAPCIGRISAEEHRALAEDFCDFLAGHTTTYIKNLEREMKAASTELDFERAARLRDDVAALRRALEKNAVVLGDGTDADLIGFAEDPLEAAVQIFHVRGGRIRGQRGFIVEKVEDLDRASLMEQLLLQLYGEESTEGIPREVLVSALPTDDVAAASWLSARRGSLVSLRVPQRGDKRELLETVTRNAAQGLALHKTRRAGDLTTRGLALAQIQEALTLPDPPLRIECIDVSNLQGTAVVASLVVFEDGLPRKSDYRKFVIKGFEGQDDVRAIHEVVTRRFRRYLDDRVESGELPQSGEIGPPDAYDPDAYDPDAYDTASNPGVRKFVYPPSLLVVDGGQPQVAAAARALDELGIDDISVCGLAKRREEIWLPRNENPVILPRSSEGLYLFQRIRDEAHRVAITHHRQRRSKAMTQSVLDEVPGVGPTRQGALRKAFPTLTKLRAAQEADIAAVPGIGPKVAAAIVAALKGDAPGASVNVMTGEIRDDGSDQPERVT